MCVVHVRSLEMFTPRVLEATHPLHRDPTDHKNTMLNTMLVEITHVEQTIVEYVTIYL